MANVQLQEPLMAGAAATAAPSPKEVKVNTTTIPHFLGLGIPVYLRRLSNYDVVRCV